MIFRCCLLNFPLRPDAIASFHNVINLRGFQCFANCTSSMGFSLNLSNVAIPSIFLYVLRQLTPLSLLSSSSSSSSSFSSSSSLWGIHILAFRRPCSHLSFWSPTKPLWGGPAHQSQPFWHHHACLWELTLWAECFGWRQFVVRWGHVHGSVWEHEPACLRVCSHPIWSAIGAGVRLVPFPFRRG